MKEIENMLLVYRKPELHIIHQDDTDIIVTSRCSFDDYDIIEGEIIPGRR